MNNNQNTKNSIDISKISNEKHLRLIKNALKQDNLSVGDLKNSTFAKQFAINFTKLICDIIMRGTDFGEFKYGFLIESSGTILKGEAIEYRCKDLPVARKVNQCTDGLNCPPLTFNQSKTYVDQLPVALIEVDDVIDKYCLYERFCSDEGIDSFINAVKRDLISAFTLYVEQVVEQDFADESEYTEIITIPKNADKKQITAAIRKAYHLIQQRNRYNKHGVITRTSAQNIYGFVNMDSLIDYEQVLSCCYNAENRLGGLFDRLFPIKFLDKMGNEIKNIVAAIFDKLVYPVKIGQSEVLEVPCPSRPIIKKQYLYNQVAMGWTGCHSRILIKTLDTDADDKVQVDNQLAAYENPTTSSKKYADMKKDVGSATAEDLGITTPTVGEGVTDTYEILSKDDSAKTIQVKVTSTKNKATNSKTITIKGSDADESGQDQIDVDNQLSAYASPINSTLDYESIKKTNGSATAQELGISKPSGATGTTDNYEITGKDDDAKTVNVKVTVTKNDATGNKNIVVKASDAVFLNPRKPRNPK